MSTGSTSDGGDRRQRPPAWILCSVYIVVVALFATACVIALDLMWTSLASNDTVDRDNFAIYLLSPICSMAAVAGVLAVFYLLFRSLFNLRLPPATNEKKNGLRTAGLMLVACFVFLAAYLMIARQVIISMGGLQPSLLGAVMAYLFFAKWPLSSLLDPKGLAPETPTSAPKPDSAELT